MLGSINSEIYLSHQNLSQIRKKICKLMQFSNNSHENSSMLGSNNIGDHVLSLKFEQKQQKICILTQFSDNSPENLQKKLICLAQ